MFKNLFFAVTVLFTLSSGVTAASAAVQKSRRICKEVMSSSYREDTVCAEVAFGKATLKLSEINFVDRYRSKESPTRFRKGTALNLCTLFDALPKAVAVEVFHASNGITLPGLGRSVAASAPPLMNYDEVTCIRTAE